MFMFIKMLAYNFLYLARFCLFLYQGNTDFVKKNLEMLIIFLFCENRFFQRTNSLFYKFITFLKFLFHLF